MFADFSKSDIVVRLSSRDLWHRRLSRSVIVSAALAALLLWPTAGSSQVVLPKSDAAPVPGLDVQDTELKLFKLTQLLLQDPQNPALLLQKGVYLSELGQLVAAFDTFEALRLAFPEQPAPYANLASIYARWGRLEEARQMLLKSDALQANRYQTHLSLASVNLELALVALNKANELKPGDPATQSKLRALAKYLAESSKVSAQPIGQAVSKPVASAEPLRIAQSAPSEKAERTSPARSSRTQRDRLKLDVFDATQSDNQVKSAAPALAQSDSGVSQDPRKAAILKTLESWTLAWTQQSYDNYLSHYSAAFKPAEGASRDAWALRKRTLMEKAKYIRVDLKIADIQFDGPVATIRLSQKYRSNRYTDFGYKELKLRLEEGSWKILAERPIQQ